MDNAIPHLESDADIETALAAMRARLRSGGIALISLRDYGPLMASRPASTPPALYRDGKFRRIYHQVWDWQDDRRYIVHLFITIEKLDGWQTRHFVGHYRAIPPSEVAGLAQRAGFDDVRVLAPGGDWLLSTGDPSSRAGGLHFRLGPTDTGQSKRA